jgi:regulator of replication initiation timing
MERAMALTFLGRAGKPDQSPEPPRHSFLPHGGGGTAGARRAATDTPDRIDDLQSALARLIDPSEDAPAAQPQQAQTARRQQGAQTPPAAAPAEAEDRLLAEAQAMLARLEANRERLPSDSLLNQIDALAASLERNQAELRNARSGLSRLQADNARLNTENERLRRMLKTLISAVDADGKRISDTIERAERRLRDLVPVGPEPTSAPAPAMRPAQRVRSDAAE